MRIESPCPTSMNATSSWGEALFVVLGGCRTEVADGGIVGALGCDVGTGVAEGETTDGKAVLGATLAEAIATAGLGAEVATVGTRALVEQPANTSTARRTARQ